MSHRQRDTQAKAAGMALAEAVKCADFVRATGLHRATYHRHTTGDRSSALNRFGELLLSLPASSVFRMSAHVGSLAKQHAIADIPTRDLILRYHSIVQLEKAVELEDTLDDIRPTKMLDMASVSERDAALDLEKAAILRELAGRGVKESEVWS